MIGGGLLRVGQMPLTDLPRRSLTNSPGHTGDSMCILAEDRVFTGDTLLIGGTGRTDLPTGDPDALYDSLFGLDLVLKAGSGDCWSIQRMITRAAIIPPSPRRSRAIRACKSANAVNSSP